tara:strand:+ start:605 stop:859 length:255 start_codon:yes stop_codon:yes gene_type:complete
LVSTGNPRPISTVLANALAMARLAVNLLAPVDRALPQVRSVQNVTVLALVADLLASLSGWLIALLASDVLNATVLVVLDVVAIN